LKTHPEVKSALDLLAGQISDDDMRRMNYAVDGQHRDPIVVVREFLKERSLVPGN
jgi:osmoprotectant transport system substrate-binding protein